MKRLLSTAFIVFFLLPTFASTLAQDQLDFLTGLSDFSNLRRMLPNHVNGIAATLLEQRKARVRNLLTPESLKSHQAYVRQRILAAIGDLPKETPLNVRTVEVIDRQEYRIEKLVFETQPRFFVTAHLYVPQQQTGPFPGILFPLGHEIDTKANPTWQLMMGTLAKRGYVVLTYDPIGQGERTELFDADWGESKVFRNNTEHTLLSVQCMLIGDNLARYAIWDGLRALDYLASRSEVDPKHIACTGNSGGGNLTAYLAALDDRIQVAAPSCWINSWRGLLETIGQQDGEQVLVPMLQDGLDHADFIYAFAPKPYLILSAIRDFFPISGVRETYQEALSIYTALGAAEMISKVEVDAGHNYSKPLRLAAYRWFDKWLKGSDDAVAEQEIPLLSEEKLWCTPTGQVQTSLGGETVFSLNGKRVQLLQRKLTDFQTKDDFLRFQKEKQKQAFQYLGLSPVSSRDQDRPPTQNYGSIRHDGFRIDKFTYESEDGILIPSLLYIPDKPVNHRAIVYVDGAGKSSSPSRLDAEQLVRAGYVVLAIDMRGSGETEVLETEQASDVKTFFGDYDDALTALVVGKPLVGMRVIDVMRGVDLLKLRSDVDANEVLGFGRGTGAIVMMYTAILDPRIEKVALEDLLVSYDSIVEGRIHRQIFESVLPGVLKRFDLPELIAALAPRAVFVVNPRNALGLSVRAEEARLKYNYARKAFQLAGVADALQIKLRGNEEIQQTYSDLLAYSKAPARAR